MNKRIIRKIRNDIRSIINPVRQKWCKTRILKYNNCQSLALEIPLSSGYEYVYPYSKKTGYADYQDEKDSIEEKCDLSIILPVYNSEKYIENCIGSLCNQNTQYNYEIIIIDDGSSDNSLKILNQYVNNGKIRIYSQTNQGVAYTRNRGIALARGEYIGFVDNDDVVELDYVETLLSRAKQKDAEIVKCGHMMHLSDGDAIEFCDLDASYRSGLGLSITRYNGYIWGGISKRSLWKNVSFPEKYWYEDMITRFLLYMRVSRFEYVGKTLYHKYEHSTNASRVIWNNSNKKCLDQVYLVKALLCRCEELGVVLDGKAVKSILREFGKLLDERCRAYMTEAYMLACSVIDDNANKIVFDEKELTFGELYLWNSLKNKNWKQYKYVIKYLKFGGE